MENIENATIHDNFRKEKSFSHLGEKSFFDLIKNEECQKEVKSVLSQLIKTWIKIKGSENCDLYYIDDSIFMLALKFEDCRVFDKSDNSHYLGNVYFCVYVTYSFTYKKVVFSKVHLYRDNATISEYKGCAIHPHVSSRSYDISRADISMCLGTNPIRLHLHKMLTKPDDVFFCRSNSHALVLFVSHTLKHGLQGLR